MTIFELYEYYDYNWANVSRELKIGSTTLVNWRKRGYIPIRSQMVIEKKTNGLFKADIEHAKVELKDKKFSLLQEKKHDAE